MKRDKIAKISRVSFHDAIKQNKIKSTLLIVIIFIVFIVLGYVISFAFSPGYFFFIMILATIIAIVYVTAGYFNSDKIALASVHAKPASRTQYAQYYHSVEGLTLASGMPMPKLFVMENKQINAFATGRNPTNSAICVTTGALNKLNKQELEGVLAHELSHVANHDIRFMTLVAVLVGMIAIFSQLFLRSLWFGGGRGSGDKKGGGAIFLIIGIALAILAPIVVHIVQMTISRKREFAADASGVKFTRYPPGLIGALKKIGHDKPMDKKKMNKAVAPLFLSDPFKRKVQGLFSTHPPLEKRIALLERM